MSLQRKLFLSIVPMILAAFAVSWSILNFATAHDDNADRALKMATLVIKQELEMTKMSEALRGYLLNPEDKKEYERKKAADEQYAAYAADLAALTPDMADLQAVNKELSDYDEKDLDQTEQAVAKLVVDRSPYAVQFYQSDYRPKRAIQNANFDRLKKVVAEKTSELMSASESKRYEKAMIALITLWCGTLLGLIISIVVTLKVSRSAENVFTGIYSLSDELTNSAKRMMDSSGSLSRSVTQQASAVQETASSVDRVSEMVGLNSDNAAESTNLSDESKTATAAGKQAVQHMVQSISEISSSNNAILEQVENGNRQIAEIANVISEIGQKTNVINDIVFQTKLLSFNASVEAARAGEHGKGFAVVAEEVGNLAEMSGKASREISAMLQASIEKVQSIVETTRTQVEGLIQEGRRKVQTGEKVAQECATSLNQILEAVEKVDKRVQEIASASKEQAVGLGQISQAMSLLERTNHETNEIASKSEQTSNEVNAQAEHLRTMANELVALIRGLREQKKSHQIGASAGKTEEGHSFFPAA